jgi:hypothetical protein
MKADTERVQKFKAKTVESFICVKPQSKTMHGLADIYYKPAMLCDSGIH